MRLVITEKTLRDTWSSKYDWSLWEDKTLVAEGYADSKWSARRQARRLKRKIERQRARGRRHEEYTL